MNHASLSKIKNDKNDVKELNVVRIILLLCSTFTLLLRDIFIQENPGSYDPLEIRIIFSSMLLLVFLLTFFQKLRPLISYLNYLIFASYSIHGIILIQRNHFAISYILEFIILIIIVCLSIKKKTFIYVYLGIVFISYAVVSISSEANAVNVFLNISLMVIFAGATLVFFDLKFQTESQLKIREELLDTVFNESPDALFLVNSTNGSIVDCNDTALILFQLNQRSEIIGNNPNHLLKTPYSPAAWQKLKQKVGKKRFFTQELEFKTQSNIVFWGSQAITEIKVGDSSLWLVRITDITEKVKDKKTIEENQKTLRQMIDLVPHPIFLKDDRLRFMMVNEAFANLYHTTSDEVKGKMDRDFLSEAEAEKTEEDDKEVIQSGQQKFISEELMSSLDGKKKFWQTTKIPFYMDEEKKPGVLGILIDITERVTGRRMIEDNRKMLVKIINALPHQIYLKDSNGKFLVVNQGLADYHDTTIDDIIGKTDFDLFSSDEAKRFYEAEQEILKTGKPKRIPEEHFTRNGVERVNNTSKMPFYINEKKELGILGVNIDVTEAKLAEKTIKESESKYKMLMEQASDGIYLCDVDGNILDGNFKAAEMFGYTPEEFLKLNIKNLIDPNGVPDAFFRIPNSKDRQSIIVERKFLKKDGNPFTVELSAKLLDDGRHQAIIRDITERKMLEQVLKDNERKFRALIENSSDIILILSDDFKLKYVSSSAKRILGIDAERLLDKFIFEFVHQEDIDAISKFLFELTSTHAEIKTLGDIRLMGNLGQFVFSEIVATNLLKDPIINGIIINCHDVTTRKNTEKELLNTNFELDSFVYKASHDLKAPLRSVMGLIRLAKLESNDERQHLYLDMMNKSVISLDQFIKDLTQFSRNSRLTIQSSEVNFEEMLNETFNNLRFMDNVAKVRVNKEIHINSIFHSDLTRVGTIFNNLISNAFKYHRFENNNPYINVIIETDSEKARISVEDNGQGINPLHIDRIFDMFYRASETSYGSGLGLYIVKNAINKLNGEIKVQSVVNQSTKFYIEIPNLINKAEKNEVEC